jgi:hypothetical protein
MSIASCSVLLSGVVNARIKVEQVVTAKNLSDDEREEADKLLDNFPEQGYMTSGDKDILLEVETLLASAEPGANDVIDTFAGDSKATSTTARVQVASTVITNVLVLAWMARDYARSVAGIAQEGEAGVSMNAGLGMLGLEDMTMNGTGRGGLHAWSADVGVSLDFGTGATAVTATQLQTERHRVYAKLADERLGEIVVQRLGAVKAKVAQGVEPSLLSALVALGAARLGA